jgi:hypothetical protein
LTLGNLKIEFAAAVKDTSQPFSLDNSIESLLYAGVEQ